LAENDKPPLGDSDVATLPQNWVAYLTSRLEALHAGPSTSSAGSVGSSSVTVALIHKMQSLQEENEELYEALNRNELGLMKEEIKNFKTTVSKLETALKGIEVSNMHRSSSH
jgi:WTAP/Mum2p family